MVAVVTAARRLSWASQKWEDRAACKDPAVDPAWFFAEGHGSAPEVVAAQAKAVAVCRRCEVLEECRTYANSWSMEYGIWGGEKRTDRQAQQPARAARIARARVKAKAKSQQRKQESS